MTVALAGRPRLDAEAPEAHEPLGVLVPEAVGGVVGGEAVVVEAPGLRRPVARQTPGFEAEPHLAGDVALGLGDERVDGLPQRAEPETVVDELGPPGLEARLLVRDVALEQIDSRSWWAAMRARLAGHS